jgi:hypothetical protein
MTSIVYRYQFYCEDEDKWYFEWNTNPPTQCPNNSNHQIDVNSISIIDQVSNQIISYGDSTIVDSYNRLRVTTVKNIMNFKQVYSTIPDLRFQSYVENGGQINYKLLESLTELRCGGQSNSMALFQTKEYFIYEAGACFNIIISAVLGEAKPGFVQELGYFDDENGIFFRVDGTNGISVVKRSFSSGVVEEMAVLREDWNGDKFDGTGNSGFNLNLATTQFWWIDFQWQGTGRARFGLYLNGTSTVCHKINFNNLINTTYMSTPSLPVRYKIYNKPDAVINEFHSMRCICTAVSLESNSEPTGFAFSTFSNIANGTVISSTGFTPILAIRVKQIFKGKSCRVKISLDSFNFLMTGNATLVSAYQLIWNPILSSSDWYNGSLNWNSVSNNSAIEYLDVVPSGAVVTDGESMNTGIYTVNSGPLVLNGGNFLNYNSFPFCLNIDGTRSDIIVLALKRLQVGGQDPKAWGSIKWEEIY